MDRLDQILADRAARKAAEKAASGAVSAIRRAFAYPRCGDGFPATAAEKRAAAWAVKAHGSIDAALAAEGVFS